MARKKTATRSKSRNSRRAPKKRSLFAYPAVVFVLLCVGVMMAAWTFNAVADDLAVSAIVPAPPVTGPAVITSPLDGEHFSSPDQTISGTCPADGSGGYVKVSQNGIFSGAAICDNNNDFSVSTLLFPGTDVITVQIYNITDSAGPASTPVTVYYDAPQLQLTPTGYTSTPSAPTAKAPQFIISSNFQYIGYNVGQTTEWVLTIDGGQPPYILHISWGDGKTSVITFKEDPTFTVKHTYATPGKQKNHSYVINFVGSDAAGNESKMQVFVIINSPGTGPVAAPVIPSTCSAPLVSFNYWSCFAKSHSDMLKFLWPAYGIVSLMVISYFLGEREEITMLVRKGIIRRHRRA